jgi:hypothetical protein
MVARAEAILAKLQASIDRGIKVQEKAKLISNQVESKKEEILEAGRMIDAM